MKYTLSSGAEIHRRYLIKFTSAYINEMVYNDGNAFDNLYWRTSVGGDSQLDGSLVSNYDPTIKEY